MAQQMIEPRPTTATATAQGQGQTAASRASTSTTTINEPLVDTDVAPPTLRLVLRKPKNQKKVNWTTETVDNEHMNKRKSKCCCIYKKPHIFGESSSESEDECDNCFGHCEMKKQNNPPPPPPPVPPVS